MSKRGVDAPAVIATGLLLAVIVWRAVLGATAPAPLRARDLLGVGGMSAAGPRRVLVVSPTQPASDSSMPATDRLLALLRSYGYETLPVLLTLDTDGHVVFVEPAPRAERGSARSSHRDEDE
ncbi:MAG TPA: hypothetical protein VLK84_25080 [Longimicrobium sp.]|nr:hypothetical protein [Longimicrobium sp.]